MDGVQILAALLLLGRLFVVWIMGKVIRKQRKLLSMPLQDEMYIENLAQVKAFRNTLHYLALGIFFSNLMPLVLDVAVVLGVDRTMPFLVAYAVSNCLYAVTAAIMIYKMYQLAEQTQEVTELESAYVKSKKG